MLYLQHITLFQFWTVHTRIFRTNVTRRTLWAADLLGLQIRYEVRTQFRLNSENIRLQFNYNCLLMHFLCLKLGRYRKLRVSKITYCFHMTKTSLSVGNVQHTFSRMGFSNTIEQFSWLQRHTGGAGIAQMVWQLRLRDEKCGSWGSISGRAKRLLPRLWAVSQVIIRIFAVFVRDGAF